MLKNLLTIVACLCIARYTLAATPPYSCFTEGFIKDIRPEGWLRKYLVRQRDGLTGHPEAMAYPYNTCLWAGEIERKNENPVAKDWWRYEQTAYYTDGLLRLGYLLADSTLIGKGEAGIDYTISHAAASGRLGNKMIESQWPMAVFFRAMQAYHWKHPSDGVPQALERHYLSLSPQLLAEGRRHIVNLEGLLWTYGQTHNHRLLDMAEEAYARGGFELDAAVAASPDTIFMHGVTYAEMLKIPLLLYAYTGKQHYLQLAMNAERKLERHHLLPDGLYTSAEFTKGRDVNIAHETCDVADYTWSLGYFLQVTGEAEWADRLERAVFNAGLGCVAKDFKSLQYFSSLNQLIVTGTSDNNDYKRGRTWMAYRPIHETECCVGNVNRFMPNFASRLWMQRTDGAIVAALYAPSTFSFQVDGEYVSIHEETSYPFDDVIRFRLQMRRSARFPLVLRIPQWCQEARLENNGKPQKQRLTPGTFVTLDRRFHNGDIITLQLPMRVMVKDANGQGLYVERGPLLYSYAVPEKATEDTTVYDFLNGKRSANPDFKCWNITPAAPFNYAIDRTLLPADDGLTVTKRQLSSAAYPFDLEDVPISIQLPVRRIVWNISNGLNPSLPEIVTPTDEQADTITLVPYGCTQLRLTVFPQLLSRSRQVNTLIGTLNEKGTSSGHVFPGAVYPHGMVQFTPSYFTDDGRVVVNQCSGAGCPHMGNFPMSVVKGELQASPGDMREMGRRTQESGHAGSYQTMVQDDILMELTATARTGMARLTFPDSVQTATLMIGGGVALTDIEEAVLTMRATNQLEGYAYGGSFCGMPTPYKVYMVAEFDHPSIAAGTWKDDQLFPAADEVKGTNSGAYFTFDLRHNKQILYKIGISYISIEQARKNMLAENSAWQFDKIRNQCEQAWEQILEKIEVKGGSAIRTQQFYTHLYHSFIHPSLWNDVDGSYLGADFKVHRSDRNHYTQLSNWDTYRTQIQLLSILEPDVASDIVLSLQHFAEQSGGSFPRWVLANLELGIMQGDPSAILVANAWAFGARHYDPAALMRIMRRGAEVPGAKSQHRETRPHLSQYLDKGFCRASIQLEYTSADFAIGQFALQALGDKHLAATYFKRATSWKNLFNPATGWLQSRHEDGSWKPLSEDFREATYKDYYWMIPYQAADLICLAGGRNAAMERLDSYFQRLDAGFNDAWFAAGNEPSFGTPWMYNWVGQPWKTSALIRRILNELYTDRPDGMPGDDDLGAMGAWYVWAALGLYPAIPGVAGFTVNTPIFPAATIHLPNHDIVISGGSETVYYTSQLTVDGKKLKRPWVEWQQLSHGAHLMFTTATEPSTSWGTRHKPPSFK